MKKFVCLIFLIVFIAGIHSCQKENFNELNKKSEFTVENAKLWLDNNYQQSNLSLKSAGNGNKNHYFSQLWGKAKMYENQKTKIIEIPLESDMIIGFFTEEVEEIITSTGTPEYGLGDTRLVIQKFKESGKITAHIMTISGAPEYMDITDFKVDKNNYLEKESDFSGMVMFHNLDGTFHLGWKYKNGEVTHRISSNQNSDSGIRLKVADASHECYYFIIYESVIEYHWEDGLIIDDSYVEIIDEFVMCEDMGGDGGIGEGGGSSPSPQDSGIPCLGDPVRNPNISPTESGNIVGGLYGCTRTTDSPNCIHPVFNTNHSGVDIIAPIGSNIYSMYPGTVVGNYYEENGLGKYTVVKSVIDGNTVKIYYGHLNSYVLEPNSTIPANTIVGLAGKTGNADDPEIPPHVHIKVRVNGIVTDPLIYFTTQFDSNGQVVSVCN